MKKITQNLRWLVTLLVMIVCAGAWAQTSTWEETDPSSLVTGDVVVIVDKTSSTAMVNNNGGSAPTATEVTLNNEKTMITSTVDETLQWVVTVDDGSYQFNVPETENYLYTTNTNNGVKVGTNDNNVFTFEQDAANLNNSKEKFLKNTATSRFVGVYNNQDWRCYTLVNTNIKDCVTAFYKKTESNKTATTVTIDASGITNTDVYISENAGSLSATVSAGGTAISGVSVTWTSSNQDVATIDSNGSVTLVSKGTTTITATYEGDENYYGSNSTYELTVTSSAPQAPQITNFTVLLNNEFFGTNYGGSASGITDENPESGTINNVTIVYAGGGNHYINNNQTRFYPNNKLTFTAPEGYVFTKIEFTKSGTWACTINSEVGAITNNTTWTGQANEVVLTGSGTSRCDMTDVAITLAKPQPSIIVNTNAIDVPAEGDYGTIEVNYNYFEPESFDIEFCESDGTPLEGDGPDWITAECEYGDEGNVVNYLIDPNDGEARTAYFRVYSFDTEENAVYSEIITVTQAAAPQAYTLTITPNNNAEIFVFYEQDQSSPIANSDDMLSNNNVLSSKEILISASVKEGYVLESVTVTDGNGDNISLNDVEEEGTAWTFIMPESNVTISCTVKEDVPAKEYTFKKVTSTADLVAGAEYIIVCESENKVMTSYGVGNSKVFNQNDVSINKSTITILEGDANILTLGGATDAWTLHTSLENKYVSLVSSSNALNCQENVDDYIYWTITFNEGNCVISSNEFNTRTIRYNSGSPRFAAYTTGQQAIQLYKKETTPTVTIGDSKWATYVAEDNVTFPTGVSAYTVETIQSDHVTLGVAHAVKKDTPILVYSETPGTYTLEVVEEGVCDETYNNQLKVSDGTVTGGATIYALANKDNVVGFYPVASNVTIPDGKAYLDTSSAKHHVKGFLALGGVADAINNIAVETANGTIFNIAGQKVQNITKGGLYIVNGKKVFVK